MTTVLVAGLGLTCVGLAGCGGVASGSASSDGVEVTKAAVTEGDRIAAGYLSVAAPGEGDALVGASSPAATRVSIHSTRSGEAMEEIGSIDVPAAGAVMLQPGGDHLMLEGLLRPITPGETVEVSLRFASGAGITLDVPVVALVDVLDIYSGGW